jgi:hypothetical protein
VRWNAYFVFECDSIQERLVFCGVTQFIWMCVTNVRSDDERRAGRHKLRDPGSLCLDAVFPAI